MSKKPLVRNVGTVCLGTVLLGLGCTLRDPAGPKDEPRLPDDQSPNKGASSAKAQVPEPEFGPLARGILKARPLPAKAVPLAQALPQAKISPIKIRETLLASVSDDTLIVVEEIQLAPKPIPEVVIATAIHSYEEAVILSAGTPPPEKAATEPVLEQQTELTKAELAGELPVASLTEIVLTGGLAPVVPAPSTENAFSLPSPIELDGTKTLTSSQIQPREEPGKWPDGFVAAGPSSRASALPSSETAGLNQNEPSEQSQPTILFAEAEDQNVAEAVPNLPRPGAESRETEVRQDAPALVESEPALVIRPDNLELPQVHVNKTALASKPMRAVPARRSISTRADEGLEVEKEADEAAQNTEQATPQSKAPEFLQSNRVPSLASLVPPARMPVPMANVETRRPDAVEPQPADDNARTSASSATNTSTLLPPARTASTLGLGPAFPPASAQTQSSTQFLANEGRDSLFTASVQPPVLSYQDELILELRIKGVNASDTIIAYGNREGVYLPLGTLARILDLAIIVSDDGHYANGWVLGEDRTLTIDLRQRLLTRNGKVQKLSPAIAAAFDGELYLRSDSMTEFLPIKLNADLREQAVFLETLEPFPFEERMQREADRRKIETRGAAKIESRFPRENTPWLLASLPVADVEIRALSDSALGPRVETDLLLAGDLGFLTAQGYLSATTRDGIVTSLVEVGRSDPDADLLGPLQATSFSVGDVSSVSLPIGLRGVAGRGFNVTNSPQETVSVFEKIDLRGILPDGFEVELYRNEILIGSTRQTVNGQYEFEQIPVDFGLNIFRLVFFGPQGQRSEQVRRVRVGDGRLAPGKLVYRIGAVQKDENVLGVRGPRFNPSQDFGSWRASAEVAYGLSSDVTTILSGAWFETEDDQHWTASAGLRSGLGGFAIKGDIAASDGNAFALSGGIAGKIGKTAVTLSHVEFSGEFIDETRSGGREFLRRSTELDVIASLDLGGLTSGLTIPLTARIRNLESANGRLQTNAGLRASARFSGVLASNTLEYSRSSLPQAETFSRLFGNFDLSTVGRKRTRGRLSLGYQLLPQPDLLNASVEVDHAIDENTSIRGSAGYAFQSKSAQVGISAVRDFDRFSLAFNSNYSFSDKAYSVGLRLGFSFGRDPVRNNFFLARSGLANSGGAAVRAFRDMDGDGLFGPEDSLLPEVNFSAFNQVVTTDKDGVARLGGLGEGKGVNIQVDTSSLPDIDLAPVKPGIEIVPRPGRIHSSDFPIVALSEVEGSLSFSQNGAAKGVSGVRLQLHDAKGEAVSFAKTEVDGYFFFERVLPGTYTVQLDQRQATRLNLCTRENYQVTVGFEADIIKSDVDIGVCDEKAGSAP